MADEFDTPLNATEYLKDYRSFGIHNRIVAGRALMAGWKEANYEEQVLRGGKLIVEFGGGIEELFAYAYATYKQCQMAEMSETYRESGFLENLFGYETRAMHSFIRNHDFLEEFESLFRPAEPHLLARANGIDPESVIESWQAIGGTIEDVKKEFYDGPLRKIYNKLKHPFLILSPRQDPLRREYCLPVLVDSEDSEKLADAVPAMVDFKTLSGYLENLTHIRDAINGLTYLMEFTLKRREKD